MLASDAETNIKINKSDETDTSNLEKIKKLGKEKKKPVVAEEEDISAEDLMEEEAETQTRIQIIRKAETEMMKDNEISVSDRKKVDLEKTGELPATKTIEDENAKLPDPWEESLNFIHESLNRATFGTNCFTIDNNGFQWDVVRTRPPPESLECMPTAFWMYEKSRMLPFASFKKQVLRTAMSVALQITMGRFDCSRFAILTARVSGKVPFRTSRTFGRNFYTIKRETTKSF